MNVIKTYLWENMVTDRSNGLSRAHVTQRVRRLTEQDVTVITDSLKGNAYV
jgi:hypothetical protein